MIGRVVIVPVGLRIGQPVNRLVTLAVLHTTIVSNVDVVAEVHKRKHEGALEWLIVKPLFGTVETSVLPEDRWQVRFHDTLCLTVDVERVEEVLVVGRGLDGLPSVAWVLVHGGLDFWEVTGHFVG